MANLARVQRYGRFEAWIKRMTIQVRESCIKLQRACSKMFKVHILRVHQKATGYRKDFRQI